MKMKWFINQGRVLLSTLFTFKINTGSSFAHIYPDTATGICSAYRKRAMQGNAESIKMRNTVADNERKAAILREKTL